MDLSINQLISRTSIKERITLHEAGLVYSIQSTTWTITSCPLYSILRSPLNLSTLICDLIRNLCIYNAYILYYINSISFCDKQIVTCDSLASSSKSDVGMLSEVPASTRAMITNKTANRWSRKSMSVSHL